jgi:hypothetical protein
LYYLYYYLLNFINMKNKDYIPGNDVQFLSWAKALAAYALLRFEDWQVGSPAPFLEAHLAAFEACMERMGDPNRGKIDVLNKNESRKTLEKACRDYVQGFLARNPLVTGADRETMGLPVRDTTPTPVGAPVGLVTAAVRFLNEGALELKTAHVEGSPFDAKRNYGVKIRYAALPAETATVENINLLTESKFTRRKKETFTFGDSDRGKKAWFRLRYENSKGDAGQWGPAVAAIIP